MVGLDQRVPARVLRGAALVVVTFVAFVASWQLASSAAAARPDAVVAQRAEVAARGGTAGRPVAEAPGASIARNGANGQMVVYALGLPLTIVDGSLTIPLRVPRATTVNDALRLAGVELGPLDRVKVAERTDGTVASGDLIRVVRVAEADTVVREEVPFAVQTVDDATLTVGKTVVETPGAPGLLENTYRVTSADGVAESRTLIVTVRLADPVTEVRHVGTKPLPPPTPKPLVSTTSYGSGDIQSIIIAAANRFGVDPNWLLRIAKCESGFNPNAYNPSGASGLFQFMPATFAANSVRAGFGGASIWDPVASANTAAFMFSIGQSGQWTCR